MHKNSQVDGKIIMNNVKPVETNKKINLNIYYKNKKKHQTTS